MAQSKISAGDGLQLYVRKSDLDDIEQINQTINQQKLYQLNILYDYPNVLNLIQKSFISLTILDQQQKIIGIGCFNDFPQGLKGKYDNIHDNLWQDWLGQAYNLHNFTINSYNSLWLVFLHIDPNYQQQSNYVVQKLFQSLYTLQPQLQSILYLKRNGSQQIQQLQYVNQVLQHHFDKLPSQNPAILKGLIGIGIKSQIYYSHKSYVMQKLQIRMARQQDHDNLAAIFNSQSQVLTAQHGQFFIADLIATQNLTRRMNRDGHSQGKAIVGQVRDQAIGLMSISTQLDYAFVNNDLKPPQHFDLSPLNQAYNKFISVGSQIRTLFRQQLKTKLKRVVMLFCDKNGQMINDRVLDMNILSRLMSQNGIDISPGILVNLSSVLQCFGQIGYDQKVIQVLQKIDQKKSTLIKKENQPKYVDVTQKLISYRQFQQSIQKIKTFDIQLAKLGYLKNSPTLDEQLQKFIQQQQQNLAKQQQLNKRQFDFGQYQQIVCDLKMGQFPQIPYQCTNAIVINLFCIDQIYQSRSLQFIQYAFSLFPNRDYIVITQPFTIPQNTLVKNFIQVPHKKNSTFQHCLYIFHKDYLYAKQIKVRKSKLQDLQNAKYLIQQMINPSQIQNTIRNSINDNSSMYNTLTVSCGDDLIGMYTVSKNVNLDYYVSHFFVQDQIILSEHLRQQHGKVLYSLINPLFIKSVRFILRQIMRLMNKTCLYFEVHNRTLLPDIFNQFTMVRMRMFPHLLKRKWNFQYQKQDLQRKVKNKGGVDMQRNPMDQQQAPFSLSMITKKNLSYIKQSNNTRIVVVGASDTGMSFIQSLLTIKNVTFPNITLLAPGGLVTNNVRTQKDYLKAASTNYSLQQLRNLMLDSRCNVIDGKMVKLDKKNKRILLDKGVYIPFDLLILSVGLIDKQLQNQGLISSGLAQIPYYKDRMFIKGVYSIDDPYIYQQFSLQSENIKLLKRKKKPQSITVYGRTPHTIAFISGLISRGIDPKRIHYIVPSSNRRRTNKFQSNQQRIQYEAQQINDPDTFEDPNIQKQVHSQMRAIGVDVQNGYDFYQIQGNPCQRIRFRQKASNYDQLQQLIVKKRNQIALRAQQMNNKMQDDYDDDSQDGQQKPSPQKQIQQYQKKQWNQIVTQSAFFITSGVVDIDTQIFNIIHQNGLVYNGRLIVKSNFQTTQNQIFACGRICEFSQRYKNFSIGKSLRLDRYNGRQLGRTLSQHVLDIMNLSYLTTQKYTEDQLPKFYLPIGIGSCLFNSMVYYSIKRTQTALPKSVLQKDRRHTQVVSKNVKDFIGHNIKFTIDPNGIIQSVFYMGSQPIVVPSLMSFIGMSITYLNKIMKRNDHGMIPDIVQFLSQNWAICLYHELFSQFRHYIKKSISNNPIAQRINNRASQKASQGQYLTQQFMDQIKTLIPHQIIQQIRQGTISFIQQNKNHLPMYYIPKK